MTRGWGAFALRLMSWSAATQVAVVTTFDELEEEPASS
jgi:hypothetical protein